MRKTKPLPSVSELDRIVEADFGKGILIWRPRCGPDAARWNSRNAGKTVGVSSKVYGGIRVKLLGTQYYLHRVIYKMATGHEPEVVDHIDGDRSNNRISNLRGGTDAMNTKNKSRYKNNTSGHANVQWAGGKWRVVFKVDGVKKHFGYFTEMESAIRARDAAKKMLGFSERHGVAP